jgi:predicted TIM-barrel enzyme
MHDTSAPSRQTGPVGLPRPCADGRTVAVETPAPGSEPVAIRCRCGHRVCDLHPAPIAIGGDAAVITTRCRTCRRLATATVHARTGGPIGRPRDWRCDIDGCGRYLGRIDASRGRVTVRHRGCAVTIIVTPTGPVGAFGRAA